MEASPLLKNSWALMGLVETQEFQNTQRSEATFSFPFIGKLYVWGCPSMYIQYKDVFSGIYMIYPSHHYTTELVVEPAITCRVNISSVIPIKHTVL